MTLCRSGWLKTSDHSNLQSSDPVISSLRTFPPVVAMGITSLNTLKTSVRSIAQINRHRQAATPHCVPTLDHPIRCLLHEVTSGKNSNRS
jgi:hypothetical protein